VDFGSDDRPDRITRGDAMAKQAVLATDAAVQAQLELLAVDALETETAKLFLASMPSAEKLMPRLDVEPLEVRRIAEVA
jgi:hypothetical protein